MPSLAQQYSSIILNQNQIIDTTVVPGTGTGYVQEFHLPADLRRGTEVAELRYPSLSGIQFMVFVTTGRQPDASFDYEIQYQVFGLGWVTSTFGTAIGAPCEGPCWMTAAFDSPVEIDADKAAGRWRIRFGNGNGIDRFLITQPNPLVYPQFDHAYDSGGLLNGSTTEAAFNFRVLALTAEDGLDFLGNQYRSVVTQRQANEVSTAMGSDPNSYWLSKPNPSKFAVENLYFDVRKPGSTTYGKRNLIINPSFETGYNGWVTDSNVTIDSTWATAGSKSAKLDYTTTTPSTFPGFYILGIPVTGGKTYSARLDANIVEIPAADPTVSFQFTWYDNTDGYISDSTPTVTSTLGVQEVTLSAIAPIDATHAALSFWTFASGLVHINFSIDAVQMIEGPSSGLSYFDGDMEGYVWSDVAHNSISYELVKSSIQDESSVVDRILIDPITPGPYFTIYYTEEGDAGKTDDEWDNKLWVRIPQTFRMERRETHILAEPIRAKYIKVEFSHLQAQAYSPGDFQQTIRYKKHPKWVLDYFMARMQTDSSFMPQKVRVIYDALDLAYNYYLDDLGQEPTVSANVNSVAAVTSFLLDRSDNSDRIDPVTLDKINLVLNPYRTHPALRGSSQTLLGQYAATSVDPTADYSIEAPRPAPIATADVSTLNRDRVVVEQDYPVMFFYLTCRHKYREIEAKFTHDRAYFVGVREIAFLRDNYMTAFDTGTYIEPAADTQNIERNEFT